MRENNTYLEGFVWKQIASDANTLAENNLDVYSDCEKVKRADYAVQG